MYRTAVRKIRLDRDKRVYAVFDQPLQTGSKKDGCELVSEVELRKRTEIIKEHMSQLMEMKFVHGCLMARNQREFVMHGRIVL